MRELKTAEFWAEVRRKQVAEPILPEVFQAWLNHPVTKRLFDDLEKETILNNTSLLDNPSYIADQACARLHQAKGHSDAVEYVFEWSPEEVIIEDDDDE